MSLTASNLRASPESADPWIPLSVAAHRLGVNAGSLRRKCAERWQREGLAKRVGHQWHIHAAADARLRAPTNLQERDLRQLAELDAAGIDPKYLAIARARREIIAGFTQFALRHPNLPARRQRELYLADLRAGGASAARIPSVTQFYTWASAYEADGIRGLVPEFAFRDSAASGGAVGEAALERIEQIVNAGNRITVANAIRLAELDAARHEGDPAWRIGSYRSVLLALEKRRPTILRAIADKGERAGRAALPKMPRNFEAIPAGDEYVGDERTLDVWCRVLTARGWKAIRPKLTCWMDMRSRVIVGWLLAPHADRRTILGALKLAIIAWGKPLRCRTDQGEDYRAAARHGALRIEQGRGPQGAVGPGRDRLPSILTELGIEMCRVAAYSPWAKPIESFFKTMKERLDQLYAAFWGGCPSERHEDRQKYIRAHLERLPTIGDVTAALKEFFDLYHHTEHGAPDLFKKTPIQAMSDFRAGPIRRETGAVLDMLFKEFVGPKLVRRDGVRHSGRWYGHGDPRLVAMCDGRRRVLLAIQPEQQGRAMVCELDRRPLFEVECLALDGLSDRDVREMHKARARLLRPYREQAKRGRDWLLSTDPRRLLADQAAAAREQSRGTQGAAGGRPSPPSLTIVRPALEAAIESAGPAPSDLPSKQLRTGTDDDPFSLDDLLDCPTDPSRAREQAVARCEEDGDAITWEDVTGV